MLTNSKKAGPVSAGLVRLAVTAIIALLTTTALSFVNLVVNYGFHPDFMQRWWKALAIGYALLLPIMYIVVPVLQRALTAAFVGPGNAGAREVGL
jgi:hypothetical protein